MASLEGSGRKQEVARGSRRWRARRRRGVRPPGREEDDRGGGRRWAGPLGELGQVSGRQVGSPGGLLSLSFISSFLFLFSVVCFDLVLDTKSFFINPENNCGH